MDMKTRRNSQDGGFDTAQICWNGHIVNWLVKTNPQDNRDTCERCGAPTTTVCPACDAEIQGGSADNHRRGVLAISGITHSEYCASCGKAYPWKRARLEAAAKQVDEIDVLWPGEKAELKGMLDTMAQRRLERRAQGGQFKKLLQAAGSPLLALLRSFGAEAVGETVKRILRP